MSRVFAPKSTLTATGMKSAEIPEPMPLVIEEVTHFSCKVKWTKLNDPKYKYIVEELKGTLLAISIFVQNFITLNLYKPN